MPALDYDAFRRSLQKGEFQPVYYFHGDEDLLKDDALREVLARGLDAATRDFNLDRRRAAEVSADGFETLAQTPPMLAARRAVVLTEVEVLQQRRPRSQGLRAAIVAYLARPSSDTLLLLVQSAGEHADPELLRLAAAVEFRSLPPDRVRKWIHHRAARDALTLEEDAAAHLHEVVGDDLAQLAAELAKLAAAVGGRTAALADVTDLVGVRRGETAHDFTDAITARMFPAALGMIPHLLETPGNSGVRLVGSLATALTGVALARALLDASTAPGALEGRLFDAMRAARPLGLRTWKDEARRWAKDAARWSAAELDAALTALLAADRRLKSASLGGEVEIVTDAVLRMAGAAQAAA